MDNTTYFQSQLMLFTVKADRDLTGRILTFFYVQANATNKDFSDSTKYLDTFSEMWRYGQKEETFTFRDPLVLSGSYKVGVTISIGPGDDYALFVTKPFTVPQIKPAVTTNPPVKHSYKGSPS
jgi:hypothetical protein